ncbi:hypothetical protein [Amycolatopsis sp. WQ 127309]|uniref:hypothetical protein n=1 Tax=Amycolatopsis sp. WQ 127309 TaxID=2932773 RepID=UPI001FF4781C|nr:hypothetical protein [Amycolatopsis sp. WQ 127309]UOZ10354.1 hypothetical protein MUY22_19660 [Amycolatopsis sp. WQ 127309]
MSWTDGTGRMWRRLCGRGGAPAPEPTGRYAEILTDPVHCTVLALVIDGFAATERTNTHRLTLRAGLYDVLQRALAGSGVEWEDCHRADLGEGVLVLIPAGYPKAIFSELVPGALAESLAGHNSAHRRPERIRLRVALHAGEISPDAHGATGTAIVHTFRLLNSGVMKEASCHAGGDLAVIASAWFYEEIIRHSPASRPDRYRRVCVKEKETAACGWIRLLGAEEEACPDRYDDPAVG